ncbi:MAG: Rieske 2Fe-2S domain-containing protein [Actinobacteria bacterium]|nr:Rieske 2Fe-2S domain-containing protein [Actinomycetota bacterium]
MDTFVEIAMADELVDGSLKKVSVAGQMIVLARVGEQYYAGENSCPHMGGDLSSGRLEGTIVTCPRHKSQFDLTDGRVVRWTDWTGVKLSAGRLLRSPRPMKMYAVRQEGNKILVDLGS